MGAGPFASKADLEAWFNGRLFICQKFEQAPKTKTVSPFEFDKLILVRHDITPRNLIRDPNGRVWMVDWGDAGLYHAGFEIAALRARRFGAPEFHGHAA